MRSRISRRFSRRYGCRDMRRSIPAPGVATVPAIAPAMGPLRLAVVGLRLREQSEAAHRECRARFEPLLLLCEGFGLQATEKRLKVCGNAAGLSRGHRFARLIGVYDDDQ